MDRSPTPSHVRHRYRIHGRVQGVGFRWWTRKQALTLGLRGTVRNRDDGSVEIHVTGPADTVARFKARLADGPPAARVARIETLPAGDGPLPEEFQIVY